MDRSRQWPISSGIGRQRSLQFGGGFGRPVNRIVRLPRLAGWKRHLGVAIAERTTRTHGAYL